MKRPFPYYPVLLACFPIVALFSLNLAMVPLSDVWQPLGWSLAACAAAWLISLAVLRNVRKSALLAALILALLFSFGPISKAIDGQILEVADGVIVIAVAILLLRTRRDLAGLTRVLNFGATVLIVLPVTQILMRRPPGVTPPYLNVNLPVHPATQSGPRPDVFFIILDGYGREDQLRRVMGYDNSEFVAELRKRGFFVADDSHSTYCQTQLSVASTLNLGVLQDHPDVFPRSSDDRHALKQAIDQSFIAGYLKQRGYVTVAVTSGFPEIQFHGANLVYDEPEDLTMIEHALLQLTPLETSTFELTSAFERRRQALNGAIDNLATLATPTARPRLILAHVLAPHPPFVFDAQGDPVRQRLPMGFWDGSDYMSSGGTAQTYRDGYVGQVQWLNSRLLPMVDALIAKAKTPPVIIIEGDHGSKLHLIQESAAKSDLNEVFGNLIAIRAPAGKKEFYPTMTSVNTFRILLDRLFGEDLPLLPDRSYFSPFNQPYQFEDVTAKLH